MVTSQLISVNFNLRSPKAKTSTPLYMVVYYVDDKGKAIQAKIPTRRKVLPTLWDSRKQQPIMSNKGIDLTIKQLQEQAELTAYIANCRILVYSKKNLNFDEIKEKINLKENNEMSPVTNQFIKSTRTAKATKLISEALASYVKDRQSKASTANEYQKNVKVFYNWIVETNQRDSAKALTQSSFNAFVEWMKAAGNSPQNVNKIASVIRQLIKYLAGTQAGSKYGITPVTYTPIKEVKEKKCEILKEEIEAFKAVKVKNDKEQYYKDVFLLQLITGQRISDTLKLIKGDYKVQEGTPYNTIILTTIKCNTTSYITETKEVTELLQAIRANKENEIENKKDTSLARYLKVFFTRAKLTRLTPSGKPLNEVISSHFARHTFVTQRLREGYKYEQVGKMIGDSPTMIEKVYGHPTDTDIIATLQLHPAAANTTTTNKVEKKPLSKKIINKKLLHLKEIYEREYDDKLFELDFFGAFSKNEYINVYYILIRNVLMKIKKDNNDIMYISDNELINTLRFNDNELNINKEEKTKLFKITNEPEEIMKKCKILFEIWITKWHKKRN